MNPPLSLDQKLIDAIAQRKPCDFSAGTDIDSLDNSSQWGPERSIDSAVLRKILLDDTAGYGLAQQPLEITGARIVGNVDFRAASVPRPIHFVKCVFSDKIDCTDSRLQTTSFENCNIGELRARYARFDGSLLLRNCQFSGPLDFESASIARDVDLRGSSLSVRSPINANRLDVGGSIYLRDGFSSEARISLEGAQIASAFDGFRGRFRNDIGPAIFLNAAKIGGFCLLSFATLEVDEGAALSAEGVQVGGFLSLARSKVTGVLMLRDARVGANLNLAGVTLTNPRKTALNLERAKIAGDVLFNPYEVTTKGGADRIASTVFGSIVMPNALINGSLVIQGAEIDGGGEGIPSLSAAGLQVSMYLNFMRSKFTGSVMLRDVQVGRTLNLSGTKIESRGEIALDIERAKIGGDVFIRALELPGSAVENEALISGGIVMTSAAIGGSLLILDGSLKNDEGEVLYFNRMNVSGVFRFANIICGNGIVSLANAKVSAFSDDGTNWPKRGALLFNGFDYASLTGQAPTSWHLRLDWLRRFNPDEFNPQPYTTLVAVLRRAGHDLDAKQIAIARHREARKHMRSGSLRWLGNVLMDATCGHGYRPWLAAMWVVLFIGVGFEMFDLDLPDRIPLKESAAALYRDGKGLPSDYPKFQPLIYSADVLLPMVNLQQKDYWAPNITQPRGYRARLYLPIHIIAGWFFTTLFVVGVTGLIRRD